MIVNGKSPHGGDIYTNKVKLDFSANLNPYGTPEKVINAIKDAANIVVNYPDPYCNELRNKISEYEMVDKNSIICGNGAADLIFQFVYSILPKKALIISPTFSEYESSLKAINCEIEYYNLDENNDFMLDNEVLNYLKINRYDVVYLCNPNNPTGNLVEKSLIIEMLEVLKRDKSYLFLDECFNDLIDESDKYTLKYELINYPNLFILKAFTKSFGMAGVRLGYGLCSNEELMNKLSNNSQVWNVSSIAQLAGCAALDSVDFLENAKKTISKERAYLKEELKRLGYKVYESKANYIFFRGKIGLDKFLLDKGIMIRNCGNYPILDNSYYRICVKLHEENILLIKEMESF